MPTTDLMGNTLDLSRPELTSLIDRYVPKSPGRLTSLLGRPTALIVERRKGEEGPLRQALEDEGWFVKTCSGPGQHDCPILRGRHCPLRESADAAIVFVEPRDIHLGQVPRLRCAADSSSPGVVAVERRLDPPSFGSSTATIGALRGPDGILRVVSALLGAEHGE
ncbi:MAG: hypothetical protein GEU78_05860 [Actinobacteria bacterium]|nr:hypothetical protein [Actinomycetota bacterium]